MLRLEADVVEALIRLCILECISEMIKPTDINVLF